MKKFIPIILLLLLAIGLLYFLDKSPNKEIQKLQKLSQEIHISAKEYCADYLLHIDKKSEEDVKRINAKYNHYIDLVSEYDFLASKQDINILNQNGLNRRFTTLIECKQ